MFSIWECVYKRLKKQSPAQNGRYMAPEKVRRRAGNLRPREALRGGRTCCGTLAYEPDGVNGEEVDYYDYK